MSCRFSFPPQNPYPIFETIQKLVTAATLRLAEEEWERATHRERIHSVPAAPEINLRPTRPGWRFTSRYITRAQERYATRTKLYREIVALLHQRRQELATSNNPADAGA